MTDITNPTVDVSIMDNTSGEVAQVVTRTDAVKALAVDSQGNEDTEAIGEGRGFAVNSSSVVQIVKTASLDIMIVTPATGLVHLRDISVNANKNGSTGIIRASFFEGITTSNNGTPTTISNVNRASSVTPIFLAYITPTITSTGTKLQEYIVHLDWETYIAPSYTTPFEWILKPNTKYLIRITNELQQSLDLTYFLFLTQ